VASFATGVVIASTGIEIRFAGEERAEAKEELATPSVTPAVAPPEPAPSQPTKVEPSTSASPAEGTPPSHGEAEAAAPDPPDGATDDGENGAAAPAEEAAAPELSTAEAADLPPNLGLLLVESSQQDAVVYIQGREIGPVNRRLEVECGVRFLRLGTSPLLRWYTPGRAYGVACQGLTTLKIDPHSEPVRSFTPKRQFLKR
jgi:hypothetical protein